MKDLDPDERSLLEEAIDKILKNPEKTEEDVRWVLRTQGIEPNLETVLSFITGVIYGGLSIFHQFKYKRDLNPDEQAESIQLLKRRAFEMRQVFIGTRIE